jgi:hypothetical protein
MSQSLDIVTLFRDSVLHSDFIATLLDRLDIASLVKDIDVSSLALEFLNQQSSGEVPEEARYLTGYFDEIIIKLEPWLEGQVIAAADPVFSYLLGESQSINITVSLGPVREALDTTLREAFLDSPPPELVGLSRTQLEQYFEDHYRQVIEGLPLAYVIDQSALEPARAEMARLFAEAQKDLAQARQDIARSLDDAESALKDLREVISFFRLGFTFLIIFILLLIAGIILIYRDVKSSTLTLGSIFLTLGVLDLAGIIVFRALIKTPLAAQGMPEPLKEWTIQTIGSSLIPLQVLAIIMLVLGASLLVISFIYPRWRKPVVKESPPGVPSGRITS